MVVDQRRIKRNETVSDFLFVSVCVCVCVRSFSVKYRNVYLLNDSGRFRICSVLFCYIGQLSTVNTAIE